MYLRNAGIGTRRYFQQLALWGWVLVVWVGFLAFSDIALAGINTWTKAKFYYGHVYALAIDSQRPDTIYATFRHSVSDKVYKSIDGGASWSNITPKDVYSINYIATDPQLANTVYAAFSSTGYPQILGISKSSDGGTTWNNIGPKYIGVSSLAIDPQNPNTIYAGAYSFLGGIYKSTDGGATWNNIAIGPAKFYVSFLAIDPKHANTIYAGAIYNSYDSSRSGIYKSTDGGNTWIHIGPTGALISFIAIDPKQPSTIYAGTTYGGSGEPKDFSPGGIYKSTDGGATWSHIGPGGSNNIYPNVFSIATDPYQTNIIYASTAAGLYKSTDGGSSWSNIRKVVYDVIAINPQQSNILYAGTRNIGIEMSTNGGSSWDNIGPVIPKVFSTVVNPQQTNTIYAATPGGVYKSIDRGNSWSNIGPYVGDVVVSAYIIAIDPKQTSTLYAAALYGDASRCGMFKSIDAGGIWDKIRYLGCSGGGSDEWYYFIVINPLQSNILYVGTGMGVDKSVDGGTKFSPIGPSWWRGGQGAPAPASLAIDPQDPETLYAGTRANGIYKSKDGGINWNRLSWGDFPIIAIDPQQANTLYVGRGDGVIKSTDGGTSWAKSGLDGLNISTLIIDPQQTNIIYAGTNSNGIYKSTDGGNSWTASNNGLPADVTIYSLAIDPQQTEIVYAGTNYGLYSIGFNNEPMAQAGPDQVVATGSNVTLDGSGSSDPDGDSLSYDWALLSKPAGSDAVLSGTSSQTIIFTPDKDGLYRLRLVVSNSKAQSSPDYVTVRALGSEDKVVVATNKSQYKLGDILELYIWVGNAATAPEVKADVFIGFGMPDGSLYFFDSALELKPADPYDPRSFIPFAQNVTLPPGFVFPNSSEANADSDGNGKLDTFRLFSATLPSNLPAGSYFAFVALAEPGSAQIGSPQLLSPISFAYFQFNPN